MTAEMSEARRDVAVVVVGLNARAFVRGCFASLQAAAWNGCTHELIYVDNGSSDGTVAAIEAEFPAVRVLSNDRNLGYCPAANQGARLANARYLLFINDDTEILGDAIPRLTAYMDAHPDVASTGARLVYPDGREQWSGRRFPTVASSLMGRRGWLTRLFPNSAAVRTALCKDELARGEPFDVDWTSAAGQMFRTEDFWAVGGFAEDYYYWHEIVQAVRMQRRGMRIVLVPDARIVHYEGQGSGPRPFPRQIFHVVDFHRGAFRAYLEYKQIGSRSPRALLVAAALATRAASMLLYWRARTLLAGAR